MRQYGDAVFYQFFGKGFFAQRTNIDVAAPVVVIALNFGQPDSAVGLAEVKPTYVRLFADTAVKAEEVDEYRARSASARAAERERQRLSTKQYINTNLSLKRAMGHKRH
ncbi:hypothetical protein [Ruminococcus sp. JL13D9]|uniref:hypothetical protein n=1 Tax=Ruminococcus sp. JL13D9 TaxID=3233381 RepID=UPI003899BDF9